jgi:hypothetical protein
VVERLIDVVGWLPAMLYRVATLFVSEDDANRVTANEVVISETFPRVIFPVVVAAGCAYLTDIGSEINLSLYDALAQVLAVIALAGFVELLPAVSAQMGQELSELEVSGEEARELGRMLALINVWTLVGYLVVGEAAALWALGKEESSTFLLIVSCFCGLLLVLAVTQAHLRRYGPVLEKRYLTLSKRLRNASEQ